MNQKSNIKNIEKKKTENFSENRMYYEKIADKYHVLKNILIVSLIVFSFFMCFFGYRSMRLSNFRYLAKTLSINPISLENKYTDITYAVGSGAKFAFFKNDLVVVSEGKTALYDLSGKLRFRDNMKNSGEAFAFSEKYMAVYTPGEKSLSLYHSFSLVFEKTFSDPISFVALSDTGSFAVCFKEEKMTAVEIWNDRFEKETVIYIPEGIIFGMNFSPNGDKLAVSLLATESGTYFTHFLLWDVSSEKIVSEEQIIGKKPIATGFFSDGRYYLAVEGTVFFYQANGKEAETVSLPAGDYAVICDGEMLTLLQNASRVLIYSKKGEQEQTFDLSEKVFQLKMKDEFYYTLSNTQIAIYHQNGDLVGTYPISQGVLDFFVLSDNSLLLCYISETKRIVP